MDGFVVQKIGKHCVKQRSMIFFPAGILRAFMIQMKHGFLRNWSRMWGLGSWRCLFLSIWDKNKYWIGEWVRNGSWKINSNYRLDEPLLCMMLDIPHTSSCSILPTNLWVGERSPTHPPHFTSFLPSCSGVTLSITFIARETIFFLPAIMRKFLKG